LKRINDTYVVDWVATLTSSTIFNLRSSFSRYVEGSRADGDANFDITGLGFPASLSAQLPYGAYFGRYTLDSYVPLGRYPSLSITNSFNIHPTLTKVTGKRTTKAGLDMRWIQYSTQNPGNVFTLGSSTLPSDGTPATSRSRPPSTSGRYRKKMASKVLAQKLTRRSVPLGAGATLR